MVNKDFVNLLMPEKFEPHRLWLSPRQKQLGIRVLDSIDLKEQEIICQFLLQTASKKKFVI